jgi:hypothetical protein
MDKIAKSVIIICVLFFLVFLTLAIIFVVNMGVSSSCDIHSSSQHYLQNKNKSDIVITFTTMPDRLHSATFKRVLCSMMDQTMRPKDIRLNIPWISKRTQKEYIIPEWLKDMPITIFRCEDIGPATKVIPTLQFFQDSPNQKLVVYDDDSVMPEDYIFVMDKLSNQYPNHCVATCSQRFIGPKDASIFKRSNFGGNHNFMQYIFRLFSNEEFFDVDPQTNITFGDIVTGWSGYLLTPNMIDTNLGELPESAFFVDDLVISAFLHKKKTPIMVSNETKLPFATYEDVFCNMWSTESLSKTVNLSQSHDHVMEHFFVEYWKFLES